MVGRLWASMAEILTDLCRLWVPQTRDDTGGLGGGGDLAHPSAATAQPQQQVPHRARLEDLALRRFLPQTARLAAALVARQPGHRRLDLPAPPKQRLPFRGAVEHLRLPQIRMMVAQKDRALRFRLPILAPTIVPEGAPLAVGRQKPRREAIRLPFGGDARRRHAVGAGTHGAVGIELEVRRAKAVRVSPACRGNERHHRRLPVTDDIDLGTTFPPPCRPIHDHVDGDSPSGLHLLADARDGRFAVGGCARRNDGGADARASRGDADVVAEGQIIIMMAEGSIKVGRADDAVLALGRAFGGVVGAIQLHLIGDDFFQGIKQPPDTLALGVRETRQIRQQAAPQIATESDRLHELPLPRIGIARAGRVPDVAEVERRQGVVERAGRVGFPCAKDVVAEGEQQIGNTGRPRDGGGHAGGIEDLRRGDGVQARTISARTSCSMVNVGGAPGPSASA